MSDEKQEALAEALREMRSFGDTPPPRGAWLELADRIEGLVREILQPGFPWKDICAKCRDGDIEPTLCAYYSEPNGCNSPTVGVHPTVGQSSAVGVAVMREALEDMRNIVEEMRSDDCSKVSPSILRRGWANILECICVAMEVALSSPARNCDVGTANEQEMRFKRFCESHWDLNRHSSECAGCPIDEKRMGSECEFAWAQMPYEAEPKGETDEG